MNNNRSNISDNLLVKHLLGEASEAEQNEVRDWIATSAANRKYYEHFKLIWDQSKNLAVASTVNTDDAWARFVKRTEQEDAANTAEEPIQKKRAKTIPLYRQTWMRAAAMLVVFAGIGWLLYTMNGDKSTQLITARSGSTTLTDTLPDGSVVVLNKNSSISYPSRFEGGKRSVALTGEAFFNITPDKSKPFTIDANRTSVTVVGTTFNVKTSDERTEVIVETGIVEVAKQQNAIRVKPNQKAIVVKSKDAPQMEDNTDELYNYYRTKEFVCNNTPLSKLVTVLNEAYSVHIVITDTMLAKTPLTTKFRDEPIDDILKVIKATLNLNVERKDGAILLSMAK